jgi:hypothetical protein
MNRRIIALSTAGVLLTGSAAALVAAPAMADDPERKAVGRVAGATYEISAEKERGFEVDVDVDGVAARSTWKAVVKHDGKRVGAQTRSAVRDDGRWEVDFRDFRSGDTAGQDRFKVKLVRVDGPGKVVRTLTFAR